MPVRKTFLRHAKDGKTWRKAVTRAFKPFFRLGWEGRDILVAISGLTNLCIVFQMAGILVKKKRRAQRQKESRAGSPRCQYYLTNVCFEIGPLSPFAPYFPDPLM